jgi:hypothetical protein
VVVAVVVVVVLVALERLQACVGEAAMALLRGLESAAAAAIVGVVVAGNGPEHLDKLWFVWV